MPRMNVNGFEFEYADHGPKVGPTLMMISGYTAQMISWPQELIEGIADQGIRVITFDNRDIGLSHQFEDKGIPDMSAIVKAVTSGGDPVALAPYVLNDMAADAAGLLDALGVDQAHILGASMGGMIAQLVALNHPEKTKSLIPVMTTSGDPGLPKATPEAMEALTRQPKSPSREHLIENALISQVAIGSDASMRSSPEEIAERAGAYYDRAYRPQGIMRQYAAILAQPRWHDRLKGVSAPTMVLHGEVDPLIPPACGKDIAERVKGARYVEIPKWGHDTPRAFVPTLKELIVRFVDNVETVPAG